MTNIIARSMVLGLAVAGLSFGALSISAPAMAQNNQQAAASTALPNSIKRAAIAGLEAKTGEIAGTRIGNTPYFVLRIKAQSNCGSGGCVAQIWKREGNRYIRKQSLPVGYLPIVALPQVDNGMPRLGVTVYDKNSNQMKVLPVAFDGNDYSAPGWDHLLPENTGRPILTEQMLQAF